MITTTTKQECVIAWTEPHTEDMNEECFRDPDEYEFELALNVSGIEYSKGCSILPRVIVKSVENGKVVRKLLMRKRNPGSKSIQDGHGIYAPAPTHGIKRTNEGWIEIGCQQIMYFFVNGKFINGYFLADYKVKKL